ncbi:uncharacterized protein At1g76070 [Zingiber officinale]|uniref:Syringolide-induced protein 14-1-1 n=1 Tax=Zingiber officinale TaxID=94328 RepID=A0A8J5I2N0_ZINOF|nr:uncharacterized protein At1g76070 [Zingiber officinale]KAG6526432.1 hypothetical protein ZIOFF_016417 [Zingiber officinale]
MEKPKRSANKASIISFFPKRRSFAGDGNAHAHLLHNRRGFSGPIVSIVPVEARRKGNDGAGGGFEEPTSPKVTCMGQVKHRKMRCNSNRKAKSSPPRPDPAAVKRNRRRGASLLLGRMFRPRRRPAASVSASADEKEILRSNKFPAPAPALGKMRRFASGRETLHDFDWTKVVLEDEGAASTSYGEEEDYDDDEVLVAHSAPLIVGSGGVVALEPKKEVNLWKRRTMPAPNPLQLL